MTAGYTIRAIQEMHIREASRSQLETELQLPELVISEKASFETILRQGDEIASRYKAVTATDGIVVGGNSQEVAILTKLPEDPSRPRGEGYDVINHLFFAAHESLEQGKNFSIGDKVNGKIIFLQLKGQEDVLPVPVRIFHTNEKEQVLEKEEYKPLLEEIRTIESNRDPNTQTGTVTSNTTGNITAK